MEFKNLSYQNLLLCDLNWETILLTLFKKCDSEKDFLQGRDIGQGLGHYGNKKLLNKLYKSVSPLDLLQFQSFYIILIVFK